jgi:hypothetical protein
MVAGSGESIWWVRSNGGRARVRVRVSGGCGLMGRVSSGCGLIVVAWWVG